MTCIINQSIGRRQTGIIPWLFCHQSLPGEYFGGWRCCLSVGFTAPASSMFCASAADYCRCHAATQAAQGGFAMS